MPFRSESQRRKFYAMKNRGEISAATVKHWEEATPKNKKLPERVKQAAFLNELFLIMKEAEETEVPHDGSIGAKESGAIPAGPLENTIPVKEDSLDSKNPEIIS